jgi:hypothetical protein
MADLKKSDLRNWPEPKASYSHPGRGAPFDNIIAVWHAVLVRNPVRA